MLDLGVTAVRADVGNIAMLTGNEIAIDELKQWKSRVCFKISVMVLFITCL